MSYPVPYSSYQDNLKKGLFIGLKCTACGEVTFPPMAVCRECSATSLEEISIDGEGTIRTFTVIRVAPEGRKPPYVIVMVELKEGPYIIGNLLGIDPDSASMDLIGRRVRMGTHVVEGDTYSIGDSIAPAFQLL